jgi:hypothetical protein
MAQKKASGVGGKKPTDRRPVNVELPLALIKRLDEAKWSLRATKREIIISALDKYLKENDL